MIVHTISLFGLPFYDGTKASLVDALREHLRDEATPVFLVPFNAQLVELLHRDRDFAAALTSAAFCVPDGMPIVWLARALGRPVKERIAGRELWLDLCGIAGELDLAVFLVGDSDATLDAVIERLQRQFPRLRIAGSHAPSFPFDPAGREGHELAELVHVTGADMVFVGLGAPKQELWLSRAINEASACLGIGVGGSFHVYTGLVAAPPDLLARAGLEWLWRWAHEPLRLFKRYTAGNLRFLYHAFRYFIKEKF